MITKRIRITISFVLIVLMLVGNVYYTGFAQQITNENIQNESGGNLSSVGLPKGLKAEYYTNTGDGHFDSVDLKTTVIDPNINFSNLDLILQERVGRSDDANIVWTGQIEAEHSEDYTFYMIGDNGFRLWIDGKLVIDHWVNDWDKEQTSSPVSLEAGKKYDFKVEYFEDFGGSNLYLRWSSPSVEKEIVPETAFTLPSDYSGPVKGTLTAEGDQVELTFPRTFGALPADLTEHLKVETGNGTPSIKSVEVDPDDSTVLLIKLDQKIGPTEDVKATYDGKSTLQGEDGVAIESFSYTLTNQSEFVDYSPIAIAMSFFGSPKTNRAFAWYTSYEVPARAPETIKDSIVEIVPADQDFNSNEVKRFEGNSQTLDLKVTNETNGSFISHKVLASGLTPGTEYKYRVGSEDNWSDVGTFPTEGENEKEYEFLYMTDSQGASTQDYATWANTLQQGLGKFPNAKFLVMTGDMVDAGALESQWLDYFGQPQKMLMNLPLMTAVGNHEGPYNDNYYHHFHYPNDSIEDPLPPGSVYSYDYGDAHVMILNTMDMGWDDRQRESFKQQIEWLKREVAETDKKWKIVGFHKAIYSVAGHAKDQDIMELRDMLYPVFDELGIDVVLQGHDHAFMRSYQMYGDRPVTNITTDEEGNVINPDGTLYMINNSAGNKYYDINNSVNKYFAAAFEQPRKPIYSGIQITENSLTIDSYRIGEEKAFDTYTIIRDDSKPEPVEELTAGKDGNGHIVLSWSKPQENEDKDLTRGFRIIEKNGRLGTNWSVYVPVEADKKTYQYTVKNVSANQTYEFVVKSVDERDNSAPRMVNTESIKPIAPTNPSVDDGLNTFGWENVPGYEEPANYEYSINGGETWESVTANPQPIENGNFPVGDVQVRVKADEVIPAGVPLKSNKAFTENNLHETFSVEGTLTRGKQLAVNVKVARQAAYSDAAYVVFELFKGNTPMMMNAVPIHQNTMDITQYFHVKGSEYKVKVFVFNTFNNDLDIPIHLAEPLVLK
ncbi:PA14 domain-containing protein [Bacillus sp. SA1-12]|uniref:PA14 domain-containing protein n=1 Tax=Bacillus sp. SA1-12 TaxID=1455638 RepID=UPI0006967806|nr:PA14 domain-containing protein [Bacillus sp. SA1-12]